MSDISAQDNEILGEFDKSKIKIKFKGKGNRIIFHTKKVESHPTLNIEFSGNNGYIEIGEECIICGKIKIESNCKLIIGNKLRAKAPNSYFIGEGCTLKIGEDCLFSGDIIFRTDDRHAIYDVISKKRINTGKDIIIGNHVWICQFCKILKGTCIKDGSVVGASTVLSNCTIANNSIVCGNPYRYIRHNIAWEKPYVNGELFKTKPIQAQKYWNKTEFE